MKMHRKMLEMFCVKCAVVHEYALHQNWGTQIILCIYVKNCLKNRTPTPQKTPTYSKIKYKKKKKKKKTKEKKTQAKLSDGTKHVQCSRATIKQ
jgi:hypothetical protein